MTSSLLTPVIILGVTGLVGVVMLYFVSRRFRINEDPRVGRITTQLPGANCGGCGLRGCRDLAETCVKRGNLQGIYCPVGGDEVMQKIAAILGVDVEAGRPMVAVLRCNGTCDARPQRYEYDGAHSCAVMNAVAVGSRGCAFGCLGCGDCVDVCAFGALSMDAATGLPVVDPDACTACGQCVKACPRHLLELRYKGPRDRRVWVACSSRDRGAVARKICANACIGCGKCARECPFDAITVADNLAYIDFEKCRSCGKCIAVCPTGAIHSTLPPRRPTTQSPTE